MNDEMISFERITFKLRIKWKRVASMNSNCWFRNFYFRTFFVLNFFPIL